MRVTVKPTWGTQLELCEKPNATVEDLLKKYGPHLLPIYLSIVSDSLPSSHIIECSGNVLHLKIRLMDSCCIFAKKVLITHIFHKLMIHDYI